MGMIGKFYVGAWLAVLIKEIPKHCYTQNIIALGLIVLEKKILLFYPFVSQWKLYVAMQTRVLIRSAGCEDIHV